MLCLPRSVSTQSGGCSGQGLAIGGVGSISALNLHDLRLLCSYTSPCAVSEADDFEMGNKILDPCKLDQLLSREGMENGSSDSRSPLRTLEAFLLFFSPFFALAGFCVSASNRP